MSEANPSFWQSIALALLAAISTIMGFFGRRYMAKVDALEDQAAKFLHREEIAHTYVNQQQVAALELRIAELVSRRELLAHMAEFKDGMSKMHGENKETLQEIRALAEKREDESKRFRHEIRDAVHAMGLQLAAVATIQKERK